MVMRGAEQDYRPADLDRSVDAASENVDGPHVAMRKLRSAAGYCPNGRQPHEWRQYMKMREILVNAVGGPVEQTSLMEDGFFCIHCTERKD